MQKHYLAPAVLFLFTALLVFESCEHDAFEPVVPTPVTEDPCPTDTVFFQDDVLPILVSNCAFSGCHDRGTHVFGITLTDYSNVVNSGGIVPGDAAASRVFTRISSTVDSVRMPKIPNNPLSADQISMIETWINQGALNNGCLVEVPDEECPLGNVTFANTVWPITVNKCQGCHSGSSPGGGIAFSGYDDVKLLADDGRLEGVINHYDGFKAMPLGGSQLPQCELDQIAAWIQAGAPNN